MLIGLYDELGNL